MAFRPGKKVEGIVYYTETSYNQALRRAREKEERLAPIREAKEYYAPGGGFGVGVEAGLERGRVKAMASGMQHLVGAGLAGTTMAGGLGKRFEEEVGAPTRARVEEQRAQALSGIAMQEAGMAQQTGLATTQMRFQAGQAGAQRDLQRYIADLQAKLQREQTAFQFRPTTTSQIGGGYAQQFPSIYGEMREPAPGLAGGGGVSGVVRPGARQYDLPEDEGPRFDIGW